MKKILFALLIVMLFVLSSCASENNTNPGETTNPVESEHHTNSGESEYDTKPTQNSTDPNTSTNQNYIGTWYTSEGQYDDLIIQKITTDSVEFYLGIFRIIGFTAIAKEINNEFFFGNEISQEYGQLPDMSGRIKLNGDSITIIIDKSDFPYIKAGTVYNFVIKA